MIYMIATVLEDDGGNYRCEANNSVGSVTSNTITLDYYLTGTITIRSTSNDTTIVFNCSGSVDGNPSPDIILHKDGDIIRQQSTLPIIYTISSPTESDAGHYMCEANNTAFSTRSSVLELYKPILEENTVGPGDNYVVTFDGEANPQQVTYVWSIDGVVDPDANSATFTFTASMEVGTVHEITVIVTNLIGSTSKTIRITVSATNIESTTNSAKTTMPSTETTVGPSNSNTGLIIGMLFVGIIIGAVGFYIWQIIYNKIRKKSLSEKQDTDKRKQDTYMDYVGESSGPNQTYQDLQHKVEESAYVNVKAGNKKKKAKI
ncbi:uncharacterized protein [Antedon mediterranea]|uniref:uncharacterized protein n=1 Tax=Antedon mediterranea TaxID=105859 RepID=UPI003AF45A29